MLKSALITMLVLLMPTAVFAQGILESVLGPGGLGVWNGSGSDQFNYQQTQSQDPGAAIQQGYQQGANPYAQPAPGYGPPQGYPPQPSPNYSQQGTYSDWQNYEQPSAAPQGPPPVSYAPPPPQQGPPQNIGSAPQNIAPAPQNRRGRLRPGQYSAGQQPPLFDENLPAGAVRITTQTPDGTTVQYYPPSGSDEEDQAVSTGQPRARRGQAAPKPTRSKKQSQEQTATSGTVETPGTSIAMPHPVQIPEGQDPRSNWNSFNAGAPAAPATQ